MKIEVNLTKRSVFSVIFLIISIFGTIFVFAYNADINDGEGSIFGHSADEVDVRTTVGGVMSMQSASERIIGKSVCEISDRELKDYGCPKNTYMTRVLRVCTGNYCSDAPFGAYCKYFYSNNSNSPAIAPSCYVRGGSATGRSDNDPVCSWCTRASIGVVCCLGKKTCAYDSTASKYYWADTTSAPQINIIC